MQDDKSVCEDVKKKIIIFFIDSLLFSKKHLPLYRDNYIF